MEIAFRRINDISPVVWPLFWNLLEVEPILVCKSQEWKQVCEAECCPIVKIQITWIKIITRFVGDSLTENQYGEILFGETLFFRNISGHNKQNKY